MYIIIRIQLKLCTPPSVCSKWQIYMSHLRTTQSYYHEICKNCTYIHVLFFVKILTTFVHDHCNTVKNMTNHGMYFSFVSNSAVLGYNLHFVFNVLNSAHVTQHQQKVHSLWMMSLLLLCIPTHRFNRIIYTFWWVTQQFMIWNCFIK